jgi:CRP/FNR family transcriptional regulator
VLFVPGSAVIALFRRYPAVALSLLETMARRVRHFADLAESLTFRPVHERLAHYIVRAAGGSEHRIPAGLTVDLALTQEQLAARVGTVRELVARALSQLEKSGVIARDRSHITIRDPVALARLARGAEEPTGGRGAVM